MKWFRMYSEARTDAKLESLTDDEFRVWFKLLCFANEQETRGYIIVKNKRLLAVEVAHANVGLLNQTLEVLSELEVIHESDSTIQFIHWDKRQFESDTSTNRWRKWRDKQQSNVGQTLDKQMSNSEPTAPDTDTDKHKKKKDIVHSTSEYTSDFERFWDMYPLKRDKKLAFKCWQARIKENLEPDFLIQCASNYIESYRIEGRNMKYLKQAKSFLGPNTDFKDYTDMSKLVIVETAATRRGPFVPEGIPSELDELERRMGSD